MRPWLLAGFLVAFGIVSAAAHPVEKRPVLVDRVESVQEPRVPFWSDLREGRDIWLTTLLKRAAVPLAEFPILRPDNSSVNLRFTLGGGPLRPTEVPTTIPRGQTLVSVRLDVVALPRPE